MRLLAAVERLLERAFERSTARLFHAPLQPVQIERRLEWAIETARVPLADGPSVPDRYRVALHPADLAGLGMPPAELALGLAEAVLVLARRRGYRLAERPRVEVVTSPRIARGDVVIETAFSNGDGGGQDPDGGGRARPTSEATGILPRPIAVPRARLVVRTADGRRTSLVLDGRPVSIGRAPDNVICIDDPRVSRHHARIVSRAGGFVLVDLGSTNGTWVDGLRVSELALGVGDRIEIAGGAAELLVEPEPSPSSSIGASGG